LTLGEDYGLSVDAVKAARPLLIKDVRPGVFHLSYGKADRRPVEIDRWESVDEHRGAIAETIDNLMAKESARAETIGALLRTSVAGVCVTFGTDPPAAMFAWEVVRYFASTFDGIIQADDGDWLTIGSDYQPRPI